MDWAVPFMGPVDGPVPRNPKPRTLMTRESGGKVFPPLNTRSILKKKKELTGNFPAVELIEDRIDDFGGEDQHTRS